MKRSHAVVAILAAATVGGTAYSMMPSERCQRADGGAPLDPAAPACRSGSSGSGWHRSRSYFGSYGDGNSSSSANASSGSSTPSAGTQRGGFGSFFSSLGSRIAASARA
jgi:hypothetical protein